MQKLLNQITRSGDYMHKVTSLSDRELFARIASGEERALEELYTRYRSQIYRFLVHQTGDVQAAEELIQEVFLAAWQGAGKFRGSAAVKTWLFRVAYYQAASWVKSVSKNVDLALTDNVQSRDLSPDERMILTWQKEIVRSAMAGLSRDHRTAIELIFYHSLTYKEAAHVVGCPIGTVKSRVSHALKILAGEIIRADVK